MKYSDFFPYGEYRENQEKVIKKIEKAAYQRKNTLLVAPNGTGKTIIALSALLPLAYERDLKIIYTCRTHAQNARIIKELTKIADFQLKCNSSLLINGISIRGRNEMCLNETLQELKASPKESMAICSDLRKNRACRYFRNLIKLLNDTENINSIAPDILQKPARIQERLFAPFPGEGGYTGGGSYLYPALYSASGSGTLLPSLGAAPEG